MTVPSVELELAVCASCAFRFLPADRVCPRCASPDLETLRVPPHGVVLASTEVLYPAEGWSAPHRLALVEVADSVRFLAAVAPPLPPAGTAVEIVAGPGHFLARTVGPTRGGRGEGDAPRRRRPGASFEPPR